MKYGFGWFAVRALLVVVGCFAVVAWPAWAWDGTDGLIGLGLAAALCFVGALAGQGVVRVVYRAVEGPTRGITALNAGIGSRLLVTLALSLVVLIMEPFRLLPFAVWLALYYVSLLCLEVFVAVKEFGQNPGSTESSGVDSEGAAEAAPQDADARD
ncbi:MAG: hypothetical protein QNJ98_00550 [Planctomycetota bacterium]|nr:hypothetical protein [Planctomycetota bacterium]